MDPAAEARLAQLVDELDRAVAARPELLTSLWGQAFGMLVSAHRSKGGPWLHGQLVGFGRLLDALRAYVDRGDGDPAAIVRDVLG